MKKDGTQIRNSWCNPCRQNYKKVHECRLCGKSITSKNGLCQSCAAHNRVRTKISAEDRIKINEKLVAVRDAKLKKVDSRFLEPRGSKQRKKLGLAPLDFTGCKASSC